MGMNLAEILDQITINNITGTVNILHMTPLMANKEPLFIPE
jgi:hypothetical protein